MSSTPSPLVAPRPGNVQAAHVRYELDQLHAVERATLTAMQAREKRDILQAAKDAESRGDALQLAGIMRDLRARREAGRVAMTGPAIGDREYRAR